MQQENMTLSPPVFSVGDVFIVPKEYIGFEKDLVGVVVKAHQSITNSSTLYTFEFQGKVRSNMIFYQYEVFYNFKKL